jgi:AcrR family transcriptional regulator
MRDLAESLGMTTAALYYHFDSKDDILDALIAPLFDTLRAFADTPASEAADQRVLLERLVAALLQHGADAHAAVMNDPSAMRHMFERREFPELVARVERVLAGSDDPLALLRARCALTTLRGGLLRPSMKSLAAQAAGASACDTPAPAVPTAEQVAVVVEFALAGLRSTPPTS